MRKAIPLMLALGLAGVASPSAGAAGVSVSYNFDVGPMTVTEVRFNVDVSGAEARGNARIRTVGMSRVFSEFGATAEAEARLGEASPEPVVYRVTRDQSDKRRVTTVTWTDGTPAYDPPMKNADRKASLDDALAAGVVDPFTAVLRMGLAGDNPCPSTHQVFDGREVFELALTDKGAGKATDDTAWKGPVQNCSVRWTPIAGRAKDKGVPGDSYDVAFAPVAELDDGRKLWLPVDMSGKLKGMGFRGYVTKLKAGGEAN